MPRIVTVHLLVTDTDPATVSDGISCLLGEAEASGFLADWAYMPARNPETGPLFVHANDYSEGDFTAAIGGT